MMTGTASRDMLNEYTKKVIHAERNVDPVGRCYSKGEVFFMVYSR
jgi:hypothetical protein